MGDLKRLLIIDGQGGGMGAQLIKLLLQELPESCELICVGTNVAATGAMLKAGCRQGASGENAVIYQAGLADVILGPIGVVLANGILGEVSPKMASAVSGSEAVKILIPSAACRVRIAGAGEYRMEEYLARAAAMAVEELRR